MDSRVDLPDPDAPDHGDHLARVHHQVQSLQRLHLDRPGLVDPDQVLADDQGLPAEFRRRC